MENSMDVPQKTKNKTPYNLVIPLLSIYPKKVKTLIWKDTCTLMLIATLFTTAKIWKQPKCPSTDERIKKLWHMNTMEYYSAIREEWNCANCNNIDKQKPNKLTETENRD